MAEELKVVTDEQIAEAVKRVEELRKLRSNLQTYGDELVEHQKDLANAETVFGTTSKEYALQKGHVDNTTNLIEETKKKIEELGYKRSELKPVLDALTKKFEEAYRNDTLKEYHIEMAPKPEKEGEPIKPNEGKRVFKQLLEYLYHNLLFFQL
jgi:chromosome segregation ATPase